MKGLRFHSQVVNEGRPNWPSLSSPAMTLAHFPADFLARRLVLLNTRPGQVHWMHIFRACIQGYDGA